MIKIQSNNPRTETQATIAVIRKAISDKGASVQYKSVTDSRGFCEVQITVTHNGFPHDFAGRHFMKETKMDSYDAAELNALTLAMDFLDIAYEFIPEKEQPKSQLPKVWTRKMVLEYQRRGVDILLHEMAKDGVNTDQIVSFRESLSKSQRLTVQKIADKFFPGVNSATSADSTPAKKDDKPEAVVPRMRNERADWVNLLSRFNDQGIYEDDFNKLNISLFINLIDFCKYAPDTLVDKILSKSAV